MPIISSDSLFHFTKKENLIEILKEGFQLRFSLEYYQIDRTRSFRIGIPMVCFCNIPLSSVDKHMTKYGNYGIGMSKIWAERNRLNPVLYLRTGSHVTQIIDNVLSIIANDVEGIHRCGIEIESTVKARDLLFRLFTFTKPFDRVEQDNGGVKYYDEREWRYVPELSIYGGKQVMLLEKQFTSPLLSEENGKLENAKLHFEPADINYIIIKEESERKDLIREIDQIKSVHYDAETRKILLSKIISAEQILKDF